MKPTLIYLLIISTLPLIGQETSSFTIAVSDDTILVGNYFEIKYEATNLEGEIDLPEFTDFQIISGPNHVRNVSISNGEQRSSHSVSFLVRPLEVGISSIPPAYFVTKDKTWEVGPTDITILPNPEGIKTESRLDNEKSGFNFFESWGPNKHRPTKKKKKLKETKI